MGDVINLRGARKAKGRKARRKDRLRKAEPLRNDTAVKGGERRCGASGREARIGR